MREREEYEKFILLYSSREKIINATNFFKKNSQKYYIILETILQYILFHIFEYDSKTILRISKL